MCVTPKDDGKPKLLNYKLPTTICNWITNYFSNSINYKLLKK